MMGNVVIEDRKGEQFHFNGLTAFVEVQPEPLGRNLWIIKLRTAYWNPVMYLRVLELDEQMPLTIVKRSDGSFNYGGNVIPGANGEWGRAVGGDVEESSVILYWDGQRSPTVRYGLARTPALMIKNCVDCDFVVTNGGYAGFGVKVVDSERCTITAEFSEVGRGVEIANSRAILTTGCELRDTGEAGIRYNRSTGIAEHNTIINGGLSESIAGIYLTKSVEGVMARNNTVSQYKHGRYWPHDGCGIFTENGSANNKVLYNTIYNCEYAFKDNSGKPGNRFYNNRIVDCLWPFEQSDSKGYGEADTEFELNILSGTNTTQPDGRELPNNIIT